MTNKYIPVQLDLSKTPTEALAVYQECELVNNFVITLCLIQNLQCICPLETSPNR